MSKIKNTQEFMDMMNDQELSASFHYQETEAERAALMRDLAKLQALQQVRTAYDKAVRELDIAMSNYSDAVTNLHKMLDEKE
jgi:ACT domain-containing protein